MILFDVVATAVHLATTAATLPTTVLLNLGWLGLWLRAARSCRLLYIDCCMCVSSTYKLVPCVCACVRAFTSWCFWCSRRRWWIFPWTYHIFVADVANIDGPPLPLAFRMDRRQRVRIYEAENVVNSMVWRSSNWKDLETSWFLNHTF